MLHAVITTIQNPTQSAEKLISKLAEEGSTLFVAGDKKGPLSYPNPGEGPWPVEFLSLEDQQSGPFRLAKALPVGHYTRKNIAYLAAMANGATCIYETDDDNAPNENWQPREEKISAGLIVPKSSSKWVNIYRYFSNENIWPRGIPLDEIHSELPVAIQLDGCRLAPIQQGLVNGSPDVDAIWRLTMDRPFKYDTRSTIVLEPGNWCPFNTQSTWWWPQAYPLLYIPSYCSFRMCDIWKSFVAQRCLWEMRLGIAFHNAEVDQDRNEHNLIRDFEDEIPGYLENKRICGILQNLGLGKGLEKVGENLYLCYEALVREGIFPKKEIELVKEWLADIHTLGHS